MTSNRCDGGVSLVPVRKIPRTYGSVTGHFHCRNGDYVQYESTLERDFLMRQDFSLSVLKVVSQPCEIPFQAPSGRQYRYTPDFLVVYRGDSTLIQYQRRPLLVEVKPQDKWRRHWREWVPKWKAARRYAEEQGWAFRIFDEPRIRTPALANIQFLRRYRHSSFAAEESEWVIRTVRERGAVTVEYLLATLFPGIYAAQGLAHLWTLLAHRRLECDICLPLDNQTELWVPDEV